MSSSSSPPPPPVSFTFPHSSFFSFLVRSPLMESLFDMINIHDLLSAFKTSWTQPSLYRHPIRTSRSSASSRNPSGSAHGSGPTSSHIAKTSLTSFLSQRCYFADARGEERGAKGEEGAVRVGWNRYDVEPEIRECEERVEEWRWAMVVVARREWGRERSTTSLLVQLPRQPRS
ncbi:hypothetical protein ACSQ67_005974 [Phaseolus vulgaris]